MLRGRETSLAARASTTQLVPSQFAPEASSVSQSKAQWMGHEKRGLMPIRLTQRAKWPNQRQSFHVQRFVTPSEGFPMASYMGRNKDPCIVCGCI